MNSVFKIVKNLIIKEPFYGLFLMKLNKKFDDDIPTAAVAIDGINPILLINKEWWYSLDESMKCGVLKHEISHLMLGHLTENWEYIRKANAELANIAMDCEVNSGIPILQNDPYCYPAKWNWDNFKGTLWYHNALLKDLDDNGNLSHNYELLDDHSQFGKNQHGQPMNDAERQLVQQQIDNNAKQTAEQVKKSQGTIPGQFKNYIDSLFEQKPRIYNWKQHFRRAIGTVIDIVLKKSRKKESVRFPDASGIKHKKKASVLVIVDTSGSVCDSELQDFFSEIHHIYKAGTLIDIIECDAQIQRMYRYNGRWDGTVSGRGGTIFTEVYEYRNKHHKDYTTCVFFTDGYVDTSTRLYGDNLWIITSNGCKKQYPGKTIYIPKQQ